MTARETLLVRLLAGVALAVALALLVSFWFDETTRLEVEYQNARRAAVRLQTQALAGAPPVGSAWVEARLWPKGGAPTVVVFSERLRDAARRAGLPLLNLRVVEESPSGAWIQFQSEGSILQWFTFMDSFSDPRTLYRGVAFKKREFDYSFSVEVGYASLP